MIHSIRATSLVLLVGLVLLACLILLSLFAMSHQIPISHILVDTGGITPSIISHSH